MSQAQSRPPSITICMAAYNEEAVIAETVQDCLSTLDDLPGQHSILVVNDGSTDRTGDILYELEKRHAQLRILVHPCNQGIAQSQKWLIREAPGDLIFHIAADGEWRAKELHKLLDVLNTGYDIVIGIRGSKDYTAYRKMISWVCNALVYLLFRKNFHDIGSIKLVKATLWKQVPAASCSAFFHAEKLLMAHRNGARIGFEFVDHVWRMGGKSKFNDPWKSVKACMELISFRLSPRSRQKLSLPITRHTNNQLGNLQNQT
jgi:glycosyltransferase involved in cell wall biosynthesis